MAINLKTRVSLAVTRVREAEYTKDVPVVRGEEAQQMGASFTACNMSVTGNSPVAQEHLELVQQDVAGKSVLSTLFRGARTTIIVNRQSA